MQFLNYVTGQTVYRTPAPLCWRKVRANGQDVWYNWAINISQIEQPDEMPQYLIDEVRPMSEAAVLLLLV